MTPRMFYTLTRVLAALTVIPFHERSEEHTSELQSHA